MNAFFSSTSFLRYFLSCTLLLGLLGSAVFALPLGATCETQNCDMGLTCENSNGQSVPPGAGPGSCVEKCDFDNFCDSGETVQYCPSDCHCGNGVCEPASPWSENSANCGQDCYCGNGTVEAGENNCTCPADVPQTTCGDGCCVGAETSGTCSADCGLPPTCPNGVVDPGETFCNCPADVPQTTCGDGCCEQSETVSTCYNDCGSCGDGQCTSPETLSSCPSDCRSCGDGQCTAPWENAGNCVDCQVASCTISGPSVCRNNSYTFDCNHYYANGPISMSSTNPNQTSTTDSLSVSFGPNAQGVTTIACFNNGAQLCTTSRSIGYCGDGSTNCNEECDFGNSFPDACNPTTCEREPCTTSNDCGGGFVCVGGFCDAGYCGDGVISQGEECETNNDCAGYGNGYTCDFCGCMPPGGGGGGNPFCGNLIVESGEQCDDGDGAQPGQGGTIIEMDQCDGATCTKVNVCGDGVVGPGEQCDNGGKCTKYPAGTYPPLSTDPYCNEESDCNYASNAVCAPRGGDGCSATCQNEPGRVCGDGQVAGTEQCDDGNTTNGDGCDNNCKNTGCGNGIVTGTEECDDGNLINNDGCSNICQGAFCGDGILQEKGPNGVTGGGDDEVCDDGNQVNGDGCTSDCSYCGLHCSDCSVKLPNLDIFFVVDNSASMLEGSDQNFSCADGICKLIDAKTAIEMFVNALNPAEDRVALIEFNSTATVKYPLAANTGFSSMKTAVNALQATGLTNMGGAMNTLTTLAGNYTYSNRVPVVIFLGDGQPTVPNSPDPITYAQTQAAAFHAAYPDFKVYSIGFDLQSLSTGNQAVAIDLLQNHIASTPADFYMGAPGGKGAMCGGGKGTDAATIFGGGGASLASVVGGRFGLTETYGQIWDQMCQCGLAAPRPLCSDAVKLGGDSVGGAPKSGFCAGKPSLSCASNAACGLVGPCVTSNNLCGGWERYECTAPATCEGCGDGVVQAGEQCDLGNRNGVSGGGCDKFCKVTSYCGDGVVQDCEVCDDGNFTAGDGCSPYCTLEATVCGDGVINTCGSLTGTYLVDGNEQGYCAGNPTTVCNAKGVNCPSGQGPCLEASYCNLGTQGTCLDDPTVACTSHFDCKEDKTGISVCVGLALAQIPDPSEGGPLDVKQLCSGTEFCDDGNTTNGDSCPSTCTAVCGNGVVEGTELCDDGNTVNTDGCTNTCAAATCGDNIVRTGVEQCDDGKNGDQNDGCTDQCTTGPCDPTTTYASGAVPGWSCPVDWVLQGCPGAYVCVKKTIAPIICTECGDGSKGPTEECDWSDQNDPHHEACNQFCLLNYCGDGEIFTGTNTGLVRNWIATGATSTRSVLAFSRVITQGQGGFQYTLEGGGGSSSAFSKSMSVSNLIQTQNNLFDELLVALPGHGVGNQPDHGQLLALSFDTGGKIDAIRPYFSGTLLGGNFKPLFIETLKNTSNGGGYDTIIFPWSGAILSLWGGADYLGVNTGVISVSPFLSQAITDMVAIGDLDNNGIDDFAFVAPTAANDISLGVVLTTGNPVTRLSMQTINSLSLSTDMQVKMSPLGDTDSDGVEDILLSQYDPNTGQMSIKRLLLNANGSLKSQSTIQTITTNKANFSYAIYGPDIDEDGIKDIVTVRNKETPFVLDGLVLLMHANWTIKSSIVVDFGASRAQGDTQFFPHEMIFLPDFDADGDETIAIGSPKSFNFKGGIYTYELQAPYGHELTGSDTIEECDAGSYCNDLTTRCEDNPSICPGGPANCQPRYIDGCTPFCQLGCGDGIVDTNGLDGLPNTADDEVCDDGNGVDSDACTNMCKRPLCGDGILTDETGWTGANGLWTEYFEMCDPAATGGTNCPNTCILTGGVNARCNYTFSAAAAYDVNSFSELENLPGSLCYPVGVPVIEGTHDTNASGVVIGWNRSCEGIGSGASSTCSLQRRSCGDGVVDSWNGTDSEECDDGNQTNGDGCTDACQWEDMLESPANQCTVTSYPQVEEGEYLPVRWLGSWSDAVGAAGQVCANAPRNMIVRDSILCHTDIQRGNPSAGGTDVVATEVVPCGVQATQGLGLISGALADFAPGVAINQTLGTHLFTPTQVTSWINYQNNPLYGQYKLGVKTMGMQYCALRRTNDQGTVTGTITELSDFEDCTNNEDDNGDGMIDCADTIRCNQTVHPHCAPNWIGGGGGSCTTDQECRDFDGNFCNGAEQCVGGVCVAQITPPPLPTAVCGSIMPGLYCDEEPNQLESCRETQRNALGFFEKCYRPLIELNHSRIVNGGNQGVNGGNQCTQISFTVGDPCYIASCPVPAPPVGGYMDPTLYYTSMVAPLPYTGDSNVQNYLNGLRPLFINMNGTEVQTTLSEIYNFAGMQQFTGIVIKPEFKNWLTFWYGENQHIAPPQIPPVFPGGGSGVQEICDDNIDQNGDGLMNCSAGNCSNSANCLVPWNEDCFDGIDNNPTTSPGADQDDPQCFHFWESTGYEAPASLGPRTTAQVTYTATGAMCEAGFSVSKGYFVQQGFAFSEQANTGLDTASFTNIAGISLVADGTAIDDSLNQIATYQGAGKRYLFDEFISTWSNKAVNDASIDINVDGVRRDYSFKKVPTHHIYFYDGQANDIVVLNTAVKNAILRAGGVALGQEDTVSFTLVLPESAQQLTIEGSMLGNGMFISQGNIKFASSTQYGCDGSDVIEGLFVAGGSFETDTIGNKNLNQDKRCKGGNLQIKGTLLGMNAGSQLAPLRRSVLNAWSTGNLLFDDSKVFQAKELFETCYLPNILIKKASALRSIPTSNIKDTPVAGCSIMEDGTLTTTARTASDARKVTAVNRLSQIFVDGIRQDPNPGISPLPQPSLRAKRIIEVLPQGSMDGYTRTCNAASCTFVQPNGGTVTLPISEVFMDGVIAAGKRLPEWMFDALEDGYINTSEEEESLYRMVAKSADDIRQKFISFVQPIATTAAYAGDRDKSRSIYGALRNIFIPNLNLGLEYVITSNALRKELEKYASGFCQGTAPFTGYNGKKFNQVSDCRMSYYADFKWLVTNSVEGQQQGAQREDQIIEGSSVSISSQPKIWTDLPPGARSFLESIVVAP